MAQHGAIVARGGLTEARGQNQAYLKLAWDDHPTLAYQGRLAEAEPAFERALASARMSVASRYLPTMLYTCG
jgi:hypothetical protein